MFFFLNLWLEFYITEYNIGTLKINFLNTLEMLINAPLSLDSIL